MIKNIGIAPKIFVILGLFVVLAIGATWFSIGRMRSIDDGYSAAIDQDAKAALYISRSSRAFQQMGRAAASLQVASTDDQNKLALADAKQARASFVEMIGKAQAADPNNRFDIDALSRAALTAIDTNCDKAAKLALAATEATAILTAQQEYFRSCDSALREVAPKFSAAADAASAALDKRSDELTDVTNGTIHLTVAVLLGGLALVMAAAWFATKLWIIRRSRR